MLNFLTQNELCCQRSPRHRTWICFPGTSLWDLRSAYSNWGEYAVCESSSNRSSFNLTIDAIDLWHDLRCICARRPFCKQLFLTQIILQNSIYTVLEYLKSLSYLQQVQLTTPKTILRTLLIWIQLHIKRVSNWIEHNMELK